MKCIDIYVIKKEGNKQGIRFIVQDLKADSKYGQLKS